MAQFANYQEILPKTLFHTVYESSSYENTQQPVCLRCPAQLCTIRLKFSSRIWNTRANNVFRTIPFSCLFFHTSFGHFFSFTDLRIGHTAVHPWGKKKEERDGNSEVGWYIPCEKITSKHKIRTRYYWAGHSQSEQQRLGWPSSYTNTSYQAPWSRIYEVRSTFYFFSFLFSIPFIIFALLFSLPPNRNSDPGSHT